MSILFTRFLHVLTTPESFTFSTSYFNTMFLLSSLYFTRLLPSSSLTLFPRPWEDRVRRTMGHRRVGSGFGDGQVPLDRSLLYGGTKGAEGDGTELYRTSGGNRGDRKFRVD